MRMPKIVKRKNLLRLREKSRRRNLRQERLKRHVKKLLSQRKNQTRKTIINNFIKSGMCFHT